LEIEYFFLIGDLDFNDPRDWVVIEFYFEYMVKKLFGGVGLWLNIATFIAFAY